MSHAADQPVPSKTVSPKPLPSRRDLVYGLLQSASEPLSIAEISRRGELHPNTVRFHLSALAAAGRVQQIESRLRTPGRPALLFRAVGGMDPTGPRRYRLLAEIVVAALQDSPDPTAAALRAGRAWGSQQPTKAEPEPDTASASREDSTQELVRLMGDLGFAPELPAERAGESASELHLRHCPFLELVETASDVVCPLHLGLMQGALEAWDSPVAATSLEPFAEPDRCVTILAPNTTR